MPHQTAHELTLHHADDRLVVVEKPAGLLSVPGRGEAGRDHLVSRLQAQLGPVHVVHRLDMATSGLMLFARDLAMQRALSLAFAERSVHKGYVAIVDGLLCADAGEIDAPLAADWPQRPRQRVDPVAGKPSLTRWRVLQRDDAAGRTTLALEPVTGRTHQLRVHLAHIGHAILGDTLYAAPALAQASPRLLLHASELRFTHPVDGRTMACHSAPPFLAP